MARPAWPPPITTTLACEGSEECVMTLSGSLVKRGDGDTAVRALLETSGGSFELRELAHRARTGKPVFLPHAAATPRHPHPAPPHPFAPVIAFPHHELP